jgi:ribosomal protein S18 acetylase RimI-like enzyme
MHIDAIAPSLTIQPAGFLRAFDICRLEVQCFGWMRLPFGMWQRVGQRDLSSWLARVHDRNNDGAPAGYLLAHDRALDGVSIPYVASVGVSPRFQRRGIGRELMLVAMKRFDRIWLHVRAGNTPAIKMYESLGYSVHARIDKFYQNGDDALVMKSW